MSSTFGANNNTRRPRRTRSTDAASAASLHACIASGVNDRKVVMAPCFIYYSQKRKKRRKNCSDLDHHGLAFWFGFLGNENHIMNKVDIIDQQLGSKGDDLT